MQGYAYIIGLPGSSLESLFLWHMVEILAIINRVLRTSQQMVETFMSDSLFSYQQMRTQLTTESPMTRRKNKPEDDATTR